MFGLFKKQKNCLGLDLGASGIKVVELVRKKTEIHLVNYALAQTKIGSSFNLAKTDVDKLALLLQSVFEQAEIKTRKAVISLPVSETFSTIVNLPPMPAEELAQAIPYEARKYVPVPIEEVVLDWSVVGEFIESKKASPTIEEVGGKVLPRGAKKTSRKTIQVLLVAVPQEIIKKIAQISRKIDLEVLAVEQEAFSIVRSLVGNNQGTYLIADLGEESTDLIIFDKSSIKITYTCQDFKPEDLALEASKIIASFEARYQRKVSDVILVGGKALRPEWRQSLIQRTRIETGIGNPFALLHFDQRLRKALREIGPFMAVATGAAMREI